MKRLLLIPLVLFVLSCEDKDEVLDKECYIVPEIDPCEGICPTYYYNQDSNECEKFITGCCGVEAFDTLEECINTCE